jgi:hypothetical protein
MIKKVLFGMVLLMVFLEMAAARYSGWQHSGSVFLITTPEGANVPASVSEDNFPLLMRLHKDFFDFSQAKTKGEDIRFSTSTGTPLAYQVEEWDAVNGTASIWVSVPTIKGNARQEIKLYWGKADAISESSGPTVFNESNGYLSVWHMNDPVRDEVGTLTSKDVGTTAVTGIVGPARHLAGQQGVFGGDKISNYPSGASSHSSEAWFRPAKPNSTVLAWGNEQAQGKVVMQFRSPPHVTMDCYFSDANVKGNSTLLLSEWIQVVHTYQKDEARIYVNGVLDGVSKSRAAPLNIRSPAKMWIGGWYDNFDFVGDIDEVRISKVARSADWIRLQYENQKPLQTLVGPVIQPGNSFSVSQARVNLPEGKSVAITAEAGGAQKLYWILKRDGQETVVSVDRKCFTLDAGRVVGDQSFILQFKAICPDQIKTKDIPVMIREDIPEPVFTLKAPATWDGRQTIEVTPQLANLEQMQARGAGKLNYAWTVSDIAVIKEITPGKLILKRAQNSGKMTVALAVNNGGAETINSATIQVKEPAKDPWVQRTPAKDEKPEDNQFYARDDKNEGTLYYNGTLSNTADSVFLKVYADDKLVKTEIQNPGTDKAYAFSVKLRPGLIKYKVEFGSKTGVAETVIDAVSNLVCGDAYLIDGQSNALATDTGEKSPPDTNEWIRSYGRPDDGQNGSRQNLWCYPVWKAEKGEKAELGYWGMELAKKLVASQKIPIFIINGAVGGTRIDQHQRNDANPTDLSTIYGRMLWRVQQARLTHGIRGILWHQGENNQGSSAPTGDFDWKSYQQYFVEMAAAWKQDFPNIQHYYVFQIWPDSCSMSGSSGCGDMIREMQRTLPRLFSHMDVMATLGIKPAGPCHYPLAGWAEFARLVEPLIERDNYGKVPAASITSPNLRWAYFTSAAKDAIALEFDQPVVWTDSLVGQFYLDGAKEKVASGTVTGNGITLKLKEASAARKIAYLKEADWSQDRLLWGENGIAALTFCDVPISENKPQ